MVWKRLTKPILLFKRRRKGWTINVYRSPYGNRNTNSCHPRKVALLISWFREGGTLSSMVLNPVSLA